MDTIQSLQWLKEKEIFSLAEHAASILKDVYAPCLAPKEERILIIGDTGAEDHYVSAVISAGYYLAAREMKYDAKLLLQGVKARGDDAEEHVVQALTELKEGIIILNMSDKLGRIGDLGKSFRKFIKKKKHRFVSAMGLGDLHTQNSGVILDSINASYRPLHMQHQKIKELFDNSDEIRVTTTAGTDLTYSIKGIDGIAAGGDYTQPGTGGNLPAGEVYAPPEGTNVNGKVVIDGSARTRKRTVLIKEPITLTIENGSIVSIEGGKEAEELQETLDWAASHAKNPGGIKRICEFGIGLNPKAQVMGAMIIDDKTLGTAHIGIGSNYWFGGSIYSIIHLDQVFRNPDIYFDGKKLEL